MLHVCTQNIIKMKPLHYQLLLPLVPHHGAVEYFSQKQCHYSVHLYGPQLSAYTYSQVLSH